MNIKYTVGIVACILTLTTAATTQVIADTSSSTAATHPRTENKKTKVENRIEDIKEKMEKKKLDTASTSLQKITKVTNPICVKTAIDARDTVISTGFKTYSDILVTEMTARTIAYKAAFDLTGKDRTKAIKTAQDTFRKSRLAARNSFNLVERGSWSTFKVAMKACGATGPEVSSAEVNISLAQ